MTPYSTISLFPRSSGLSEMISTEQKSNRSCFGEQGRDRNVKTLAAGKWGQERQKRLP